MLLWNLIDRINLQAFVFKQRGIGQGNDLSPFYLLQLEIAYEALALGVKGAFLPGFFFFFLSQESLCHQDKGSKLLFHIKLLLYLNLIFAEKVK